jgi:hypothetical protein
VGLASHAPERRLAIEVRRPPIAESTLLRLGRAPHRVELLGALEGRIGQISLDEDARRRGVVLEPLGLEVGPDLPGVAAELSPPGALDPVDAQPGEVLEESGYRRLGGAGLIGVLDAQQVAAASLGEGPVEERRPRASYVQVPRRGGGETRDDRVGHGSEEPTER